MTTPAICDKRKCFHILANTSASDPKRRNAKNRKSFQIGNHAVGKKASEDRIYPSQAGSPADEPETVGSLQGIASLNRLAKGLRLEEAKPKLEAPPEEVKASRLAPERIHRLRKKLGISLRELGILTEDQHRCRLIMGEREVQTQGRQEGRACGRAESKTV